MQQNWNKISQDLKVMQKVVLYKENNFFFFFLLFFSFFSCDNYEKKEKRQRELYYVNSVKAVGLYEYYTVYTQANDTINTWIQNGWGYKMQKSALEWQLDSLICFNQIGNKCIMAIMNRESERVNNSINHFYGVKIKDSWYFFRGPTLYAFSEFYNLPPKVPLSFEKLKQIATMHIYQGYLKKGKKGEWEINDKSFDQIIPSKRSLEFYNLKNEEEYVKFIVEVNKSSDVNATFKKYQEK
jgi:hypothetical protein